MELTIKLVVITLISGGPMWLAIANLTGYRHTQRQQFMVSGLMYSLVTLGYIGFFYIIFAEDISGRTGPVPPVLSILAIPWLQIGIIFLNKDYIPGYARREFILLRPPSLLHAPEPKAGEIYVPRIAPRPLVNPRLIIVILSVGILLLLIAIIRILNCC